MFFGGHYWEGFAYTQLGKPEEGFAPLQLAVQLENGPFTLGFLGSVYGFMGDKSKAQEVIKQLESMQANSFIADVYISIGEYDNAFLYYDKAVDAHEEQMLWKKIILLSNPELKQDPRTKKLLDRIRVPY